MVPKHLFDLLPQKACSICLEEMDHDSALMLQCGHVFHNDCVYYERKCPMCRAVLNSIDHLHDHLEQYQERLLAYHREDIKVLKLEQEITELRRDNAELAAAHNKVSLESEEKTRVINELLSDHQSVLDDLKEICKNYSTPTKRTRTLSRQ